SLAKVPVSVNEPLEFTMAVNGAAFRANSWFFCESWGVTESVSATLLRGKISDDHHLLDCGTWSKPLATLGCCSAGSFSVAVTTFGSKPTTGGKGWPPGGKELYTGALEIVSKLVVREPRP